MASIQVMQGEDLLKQCRELCSVALSEFRENHDLCEESGLFSNEVLMKMDTCALDFRRLGFTSVIATKCVSNAFLQDIIFFHKNISEFQRREDIIAQLQHYGEQANQLGEAFERIGGWYRKLAGSIHTVCHSTTREAEVFLREFKKEEEEAQAEVRLAKSRLEAAKADSAAAHWKETKWIVALAATGWTGLGFIVSSVGLLVAKASISSTAEAKAIASRGLEESRKSFKEVKDRETQAKIIAKKAGKLVATLNILEYAAEEIATYWNKHSNIFNTQGQSMKNNQSILPDTLLPKAIKNKLESWEKIKSDFETYFEVMSEVLNFYNFETNAEPTPTEPLVLDKLGLTLEFPATMDTSKIRNPQ